MRLAKLISHKSRLTLISLLSWFIAFTIFQYIDPFFTINHCNFPRISNDLEYDPDISISKVLIIADPQLIDNHTYPSRNSPLLTLSKFTVDNYIYKNYVTLIKELEPQTIIFLGDLLDNGRESTDKYYENEYQRFIRIFINPLKNKNVEILTNIPGNHDIGWADGVTQHSSERFIKHFGQPNKIIQKGNHDLVLLDNLSMTNKIDDEIPKSINQFLDKLKETEKERTRILFNHIPLWRDPNVQVCGTSRESNNPFPVARGYQYQTLIGEAESLKILRSVQPDIIFSGDDHDYCEVVHSFRDNKGKEHKSIDINVKSISMAMGINKPAVELLTLYNKPIKIKNNWKINDQLIKSEGEYLDYAFDICYLTTPYVDIITYIILAIFNGLAILMNCREKKKRYVSITDNTYNSENNYLYMFIKTINWIESIKLALIQGFFAIILYYLFTIH